MDSHQKAQGCQKDQTKQWSFPDINNSITKWRLSALDIQELPLLAVCS